MRPKKKSSPINLTQYYLLSILLVVLATVFLLSTPLFLKTTEKGLITIDLEIPKNNAQVNIPQYLQPPIAKNLTAPFLTARSVYVEELDTNTVLYQKNENQRVPIASTTKIMTAIVASEYFKSNSVLVASEGAKIKGSTVGLQPGEALTFRSLLYGMLLNSGNDAAYTIAENYPGGLSAFIGAMNKKAGDLGLTNTHFDNPAGFDSVDHFSSAADLAKIAKESLKNQELARIFSTKETEVLSTDKTQRHQLVNLNRLLSDVKGVLGIKTGYTDLAKENLVGLVERDNHKVLTVVLGSDDRFGETTLLIEWIYQNFEWNQ